MTRTDRRHGASPDPRPLGRPVRILVVDDRPQNLLALSSILEGPDRIIEQARSGREALRLLLRHTYALILLDVNMPDIDGFETAQLIRERPSSAHTPIVFVTAHHDDALVGRSYALGAVDYIAAPVNPDMLRAKAAVFVELFRKTEESRHQEERLRRAEARLRRQAEARLREVDERLKRVVESVRDYAIFSLDLQERIATWNAGGERLFGWSSEEATGLNCRQLLADQEAGERATQAWQVALSGGRSDLETWFATKDGGAFYGDAVITAMFGRTGSPIGVSFVVHDITERRRADEALRQKAEQLAEANRLKDEFLAVLSHELRTPLNAIIGWTQMLRRPDVDPALAQQALASIARNGQVQLGLINDILDVSRFITGKVRLTMAPVDVRTVARAAVDTVAVAAQAKNIDLNMQFVGDEPLMVNGDAERLQQVVWNLVANAVKFTADGGHVTLVAERQGRSIVLSVTDDGRGISRSFLPYVFDRFRQADSSTIREHGGLGLGLAIVRHLAEAHGGSVAATSEGEGRGARFEIRLPVLVEAALPEAGGAREAATVAEAVVTVSESPVPDVPVTLQQVRCLVVDDDLDARELLKRVFAQAGATVIEASGVQQALELLGNADLLVADIGMPGQDGYSLIRQVRALPADRGGRVPAIAVTAYASDKDRRTALVSGFDVHLVKPVKPGELLLTAAELVRNRLEGRVPPGAVNPDAPVVAEGGPTPTAA